MLRAHSNKDLMGKEVMCIMVLKHFHALENDYQIKKAFSDMYQSRPEHFFIMIAHCFCQCGLTFFC